MPCHLFIKRIKLTNDHAAIIKSKWSNEKIKLQIFVEDDTAGCFKLYQGECTIEDINAQCEALDIEHEILKDYLTKQEDMPNILYEIVSNKKFIIYMKECIGSEDEFADIIYFKQTVQYAEFVDKEFVDVLKEQLEDLEQVTSELSSNKLIIQMNREDLKEMTERYEKLVTEKKLFDRQFNDKVIHLLNAKKKFIQENLTDPNVTRLNISHDMQSSDDLVKNAAKVSTTQEMQASTSKTPSKRPSTSQRTPKRTPSKKLRAIQDLSDSDDSFTVLPLHESSANKFSSRHASDSLDTSRVFKNFKIKTPLKSKMDEKRESSVELKIEKSTQPDSSSESCGTFDENTAGKFSIHQNTQNLDASGNKSDDNKLGQELGESSQTLKFETQDFDAEIPCSQESPFTDLSASYSTRKSLRSKSKQRKIAKLTEQDPYQVDTINILDSKS